VVRFVFGHVGWVWVYTSLVINTQVGVQFRAPEKRYRGKFVLGPGSSVKGSERQNSLTFGDPPSFPCIRTWTPSIPCFL